MEFIALLVLILGVVLLQNHVFKKYTFKNLEYRCYFNTDEAQEGNEVQLVEEIINRKWLPVPWLKSELTVSKWLELAGAQSIITDKSRFVPSFFMVKGYQKVSRVWKVNCLKRGEYPVQKVILVSTDLLGNVSLSQPVPADTSVLVLPKPAELEMALIRPNDLYGDTVVKRHLLQDPFWIAGVREYQPGDPMNRIHWPATAREQKIMVHNNESSSQQNLTVILNMQSREYENGDVVFTGLMENAIRVTAALFERTLEEHLPFRFLSNAGVGRARTTVATQESWGEEYVRELMRLLARLELYSSIDFYDYLNEIYMQAVSTDIILVTSYLGEPIFEFARRKRNMGIAVRIFFLGHGSQYEIPDDCDVECLPQFLENEEEIENEKV